MFESRSGKFFGERFWMLKLGLLIRLDALRATILHMTLFIVNVSVDLNDILVVYL